MRVSSILFLVLILLLIPAQSIHAQFVLDPNLIVEEFVTGLSFPTTSMTFVGSDILVLQKK